MYKYLESFPMIYSTRGNVCDTGILEILRRHGSAQIMDYDGWSTELDDPNY